MRDVALQQCVLAGSCVGLLCLQGWEDRYITGTCPQLLKWKFAHLNSVDFLLDIDEAGEAERGMFAYTSSEGNTM